MRTSRRTFLRLSGSAAALNVVPSRVRGRRAPGGKVVMGMIGAGGMGAANLDAFLALDDVVVRAVCDVRDSRALAAKARVDAHYGNRDCAALRDYRALCARPDIDAVMIATPDHTHAAIGIEAARCGKDIYGETPFTHTLAEGRALADAVARHGRVWQTGSWVRSEAAFGGVAGFVRNGGLGAVARVEVGLPGGGRGPANQALPAAVPSGLDWPAWLGQAEARPYQGVCDYHWRWISAWGGGMLADWVGLYGDLALWGLGRDRTGPVRIEGRGAYPSDGPYDTATAFSFRCIFRDGVELAVADGGRVEKGVGVRWIGGGGEWVWVTRGAVEASRPEILAAAKACGNPARAGLHRNFIDCVKTRQATVAPAESAHRAASLGHLGEIAMRTERVLRFDPEAERILGDTGAAARLG